MLNFLKRTEKTAKSVDEAKKLALAELGILEDEAIIEVKSEGGKGFLGLLSKGACVSAEVKDDNVAVAKKFLAQIFDAMKLDVEIKAKSDVETLEIELFGDDMGIVIGKRGDTLDSLQYLTSLVVNSFSDEYIRVTIDTENYRQKRNDTLIALSDRIAEKVVRTGRKQTLDPMNPYERRIIHSNLQKNEEVTTFSIGEEPYRKIVIAPKNAKPYSSRGGYGRRNSYANYESEETTEYTPSYDDENSEE